ncbi:MAG TPA: hypothetical protein VGL05_23290 [Kribbella sp.]
MPELKDALRSLADQHASEATHEFSVVVARAKRRRRTRSWATVAAAVVAVGVVAVVAPWQHTDPPPVAKPPNPILVTPETAKPGQLVALTFPQSSPRGIAFQIAAESAPDKVLYYLTSDWGDGRHRPTWGTPGGPDVGISGPGPEHVIVPDPLPDGRYRLCTANARVEVCGLLIVAR